MADTAATTARPLTAFRLTAPIALRLTARIGLRFTACKNLTVTGAIITLTNITTIITKAGKSIPTTGTTKIRAKETATNRPTRSGDGNPRFSLSSASAFSYSSSAGSALASSSSKSMTRCPRSIESSAINFKRGVFFKTILFMTTR